MKAITSIFHLLLLASPFWAVYGATFPPLERGSHPLPKGVITVDIEPGKTGSLFIIASDQPPRTFNPLVSEDVYSSLAIDRMLAGLIDYNYITFEYEPKLAENWNISSDKRSYTFTLRSGIRWSDGELFTVDDIIFTFDCIFNENFPNRASQQLTISGEPIEYTKVNDRQVKFTTPKPYAPFLSDISGVNILPKHKLEPYVESGELMTYWSSQTAIETPEEIVGTGPFILHTYTPGERVIYQANPHYWKADKNGTRLPYIDYLVDIVVPDPATKYALFSTGQLDASALEAKDLDWIKKMESTYDFTVHDRGPATGISFFWFNQKPGKNENGEYYVEPHKFKWFTNKLFRQAIMYGFNRESLIDILYFGRGDLVHGIKSPLFKKWHSPNIRRYNYDPEKARSLFKEAGFAYEGEMLKDAEGNAVEFELLVSKGVGEERITVFQSNMKELGIEVKVTYLDFGTLISKTTDSEIYEAGTLGFSGGVTGEPSGGKALWKSDGRLHIWHKEQETPATEWEARIDELWDLQEGELDPAKRAAYYFEIQDIISEQVPLLFITVPNTYAGLKNKWKNIKIPPIGSLIWNMDEIWAEPEL